MDSVMQSGSLNSQMSCHRYAARGLQTAALRVRVGSFFSCSSYNLIDLSDASEAVVRTVSQDLQDLALDCPADRLSLMPRSQNLVLPPAHNLQQAAAAEVLPNRGGVLLKVRCAGNRRQDLGERIAPSRATLQFRVVVDPVRDHDRIG